MLQIYAYCAKEPTLSDRNVRALLISNEKKWAEKYLIEWGGRIQRKSSIFPHRKIEQNDWHEGAEASLDAHITHLYLGAREEL